MPLPGLPTIQPHTVLEQALATPNDALAYTLIFILAAIPWIEILLVIPPALALGLDPILVTLTASLGNAATLYAAILLHERLAKRWQNHPKTSKSKRTARARNLWKKYGLAPLAIASPLLTGSHLAAILALLLGSKRGPVTLWMTTSLAAWSILLTLATIQGIAILT